MSLTCHLPSFSLKKVIINGPSSIFINEEGTWVLEIHVNNIGKGRISNVVMVNILHLNHISNVNVLSVSKGYALFVGHGITWSIGSLKSEEEVVLSVEITGSFSEAGKQLLGEVTVSGLDPILDTIVEGPVRDVEINVL